MLSAMMKLYFSRLKLWDRAHTQKAERGHRASNGVWQQARLSRRCSSCCSNSGIGRIGKAYLLPPDIVSISTR